MNAAAPRSNEKSAVQPPPPHAVAPNARSTGVTGRRLALVLLAIPMALIVMTVSDEEHRGVIIALLAAEWVLMLPVLWPRDFDLFSPLSYTALVQGLALAAGIAYYYSHPLWSALVPVGPTVYAGLLVRVAIATAAGTLAYWAGYAIVTSKRKPAAGAPAPTRQASSRGEVEWDRRRLALVCGVCLLAFAPAYYFFQGRVGVDITDATHLDLGKAVWREDPTLTWLHRAMGIGLLVPLLLFARAATRRRPRDSIIAGLLSGVLAFLIVRLGQRGNIASFIVTVLVVLHYLYKRIPLWAFLVLGVLGMSLSNILGTWRHSQGTDVASLSDVQAWNPGNALAAQEGERERLGAFALVQYAFPDRNDFLLGESYIGLIVAPIPRWLWPEKGNYFVLRDNVIVYHLVGSPVPTSFEAALYANFGWVGMLLGLFGWGAFQGRIYRRFRRGPATTDSTLIYAVLLVHFTSVSSLAVSDAIGYVLPTLAALWFVRGRGGASVRSPLERFVARMRKQREGDGKALGVGGTETTETNTAGAPASVYLGPAASTTDGR